MVSRTSVRQSHYKTAPSDTKILENYVTIDLKCNTILHNHDKHLISKNQGISTVLFTQSIHIGILDFLKNISLQKNHKCKVN